MIQRLPSARILLGVVALVSVFATVRAVSASKRTSLLHHEKRMDAVTVGDPNDADSLGRQITEAYEGGARSISIRNGVYRFARQGHTLIDLREWHDAKIDGNGATLISAETDWGHELFHLEGCSHVEIDNLVLSQNWQTWLQGRILSVMHGGNRLSRCVWKPDVGYPTPEEGATRLNKGPNIVDGKTGKLKLGIGDEWDAGIVSRGDGTYEGNFARKVNLEVGDWLVSRGRVAPCKIHLLRCHGCLISGVTLERNAFASILENEGGGNEYLNCVWSPGSKTGDETADPLVSCSVDGFHSDGANPGPDLEDCRFKGIVLDDCISIDGYMQQVVGVSGSELTINKDGGHLAVGQPIRLGAKGFFLDATVTSMHLNSDHTATVEIDKRSDVPVGAMVSDPLWNGPGFKVVGCEIGGTRSRGIWAKGDHGLVSDNVISRCGMSGVGAGPDYPLEGDFVEGLTVKRNHFIENGFGGHGLAAVFLHGGESMGNRDVDIQDNEFTSDYSGDILIDWTFGVHIGKNRFSGPQELPFGLEKPRPVIIHHSADVFVRDSEFQEVDDYLTPFVVAGEEVRNVHIGP
jgi:hypothetical protein